MLRQDLLEAGEATAVVGAILWLVQTILETLQPGELDAWLHRVGLAGAIGELKSEAERMETVVNGVVGRAVGNKPLARSLARVKELMYDADDVVDELDDCRLQHQAERVMLAPAIEPEGVVGDGATDGSEQNASASTAEISNNNGRKNRSKERDYFHITPAVDGQPARAKCIDCGTQVVFSHGTSVLRKHRNSASCKKKRAATEEAPNCSSAGHSVQNGATISTNDSEGRKRMRTEYSVATTTHLWDKAEFFKRIQEIVLELQIIRGDVIEYLKDSVARSNQSDSSDTRVRTSSSPPGKVYGRAWQKDYIISVIKATKSKNITVLPIVGILGVGKTALAKLVYHDQHVKRNFERIWIWVSNIFDKVRVTREILDVVTLASHEGSCKRESYEGISNYSKLLEALKKHMACLSKKFLLILDDVYDCMDNSQWKDLIDALGSSCRKGNVIIVTVRNLSVAKRLGTVEPLQLGALGNYDFWLLFKACAFGDNNYKEHIDIGRQIAAKLNGNPLAAESAADMLREQPTLHHWKSIMKNGVWESLQLRGGIVTALKISYYQLPYHLQRCLLFCSIFPNGYLFHIVDLVYMWISSRFVKSAEIGHGYLNDLVNSGFFEQVIKTDSILGNQKCYVLCGIMHEFARLVSRTEFATIDGLECKEVLPSVRHLSVLTDSVNHGIIPCNLKFEEKMESLVSSVKRLRTLILIGHYDPSFFRYFHTFMCNSVNCTHLRYLKLENKGSSEALSISLSKFYHLEVLDVGFQAIHDISDLISTRHLVLTKGANGVSSPTWSACLQTIHLEGCNGCQPLPSLERLIFLTNLKLRNMLEVTKLFIPSLKELVLIDMPKLDICFSNSVRGLNSSLRVLEIRRCKVLKAFPLFERCENFEIEQKSWLPNISELTIHECPNLMVSNPLPPSSRFCKVSIIKVSAKLPNMEGSSDVELSVGHLDLGDHLIELTLDDKILSFYNLRTITQLKITAYKNLSYISLKGLRQLVCLKRLEIWDCANIFSSDVPSVHAHEDMAAADFDGFLSLKCLIVGHCGITGQWLSVMLQCVQALEELRLMNCKQITGLLIEGKENSLSNLTSAPHAWSQGHPDSAWTSSCPNKVLRIPSTIVPSLKLMEFIQCKLTFQGNMKGFSRFTSLEDLAIVGCGQLISSLVHEDKINDQANGRLPCSLGVLDIRNIVLGTLKPCLTHLTTLQVSQILGLKSLQLHFCTALEKLTIKDCESLGALEGVRSLSHLRFLKVSGCPSLPQHLKSLSMQSSELCPRLEMLCIDDYSFLTMPFCTHLTSLKWLQFQFCHVAGLTGEQETSLKLLTSLRQIRFDYCYELSDLPVCLHSLLSLKRLEIRYCPSISRLPERGLPPSLEQLGVHRCSEELTEQCRMLATAGELDVEINGKYVDC